MEKLHYNVVVIGGGPGGYTAALYCARAGLSVLVLEKMAIGGQMATTTAIENYPGFDLGVDGYELGMKMQAGAERFGAVTQYGDVQKVELSASPKKIITDAGEYTADSVILATGAAPRELGLPREQELRGRGVSYCATCDGRFYQGKTVVVAGGGNSAAADALALSKLCKKVYLLHRRDSLKASHSYLAPLEAAENIEFIWNAQIEELIGSPMLTGVRYLDKVSGQSHLLEVDGLFVAIGRVPTTELFRGQIDLDKQGYIAADESTRTNLPGVYAVGDVRSKPLRQIVTAVGDGATASKFIEESAF